MFCPKCGTANEDSAVKCVSCGEILQPAAAAQPVAQPAGPMPTVASHLVLAILTTIFCCLPLGIVSIIFAAQVNSKLHAGDYPGAVDCSKKAALFGWLAFGIGLVGTLIYAIFVIIGIAASEGGY